ncbi:MAG: methyltransferase domain-containing protein [Candidatus Hydrogenedentota bacterium]
MRAQQEGKAFGRIAHYYEVLANAERRLYRESPLLRMVLQLAPGNRVLELACGTGLHALWFAEEGAEVTASDLSEAMIAYARQHRPHERIQYLVHDMRTPPHGIWDLAVCLGSKEYWICINNDSSMVDTITGRSAEILLIVRDENIVVFRTVFQESTIVCSFAKDRICRDHFIAA